DDLLFRKSALAHLASSLSRTLQIRGRISGGWVNEDDDDDEDLGETIGKVKGVGKALKIKIQEHRIRSDNAQKLVGTIYISRNKLLIDGDKPIAAASEYTVIVAREFELAEGPEVVLNTDYALSDVPVPEGVGNQAAAKVRIRE
ncbi:MAG: hypothetical protein SGJ21_02795, partial [Alphaproteobacteria bacterium]|nr:hypothetical protein [Alphaproteobacteria bacterium]